MSAIVEIVFKRLLRQKIILVILFVFPCIPLIALISPSSNDLILISYGLFGLFLLFSSIFLTKQIIEDRQQKVVVRIAASPVSHARYLTAHLTAYSIITMGQIVLFNIVGIFIFTIPFSFLLFGFIHLFFFGIVTITFALFWHTLFKTFATSIAIYSIVANIIALLGGLSFPLHMLPKNIRQFSVVLPTYWYANGLDLAVNQQYFQSFLNLLIVVGFGIIFLILGSKRRFE